MINLKTAKTGEADITVTYISSLIVRLDAGDPIVLLAGGHVGCFELFGSERVRAIRDLKGKTVATSQLGHWVRRKMYRQSPRSARRDA